MGALAQAAALFQLGIPARTAHAASGQPPQGRGRARLPPAFQLATLARHLRLDENPGLVVNPELRVYSVIWCAWAVLAIAVVPYLLLRPAPYGRHTRKGFGPLVGARLAWLLIDRKSVV